MVTDVTFLCTVHVYLRYRVFHCTESSMCCNWFWFYVILWYIYIYIYIYTPTHINTNTHIHAVMRSLTTGVYSEICVVKRIHRWGTCTYTNPRQYSTAYCTPAVWYSLSLLGYKPVQHVTVLNTVGNSNAMVSILILYYNFMGKQSNLRNVHG